jgi:hypothetical protein
MARCLSFRPTEFGVNRPAAAAAEWNRLTGETCSNIRIFGHVARTSVTMKIVPKIKLEILSPGQLKAVLFITYFCVFIGATRSLIFD